MFKKAPESVQYRGIVEELLDHGLVNDKLFDLLVEFEPEQKDRINRVRAEYVLGGGDEATDASVQGTPATAPAVKEQPTGLSAERLAWRQRIKSSIQKYSQVEPEKPLAWIEAAAVLPDFAPTKIRPFIRHGERTSTDSIVKLAAYCDKRSDGRWTLELNERRAAISRLWDDGEIIEALSANTHEKCIHTNLLASLAQQHPIPFRAIGAYQNLLAALDIADWFTGKKIELFNEDRVHAAVEQYERIAPLRKLVGTHFRGRIDELEKLRSHGTQGPDERPILTLWGAGGAGKSTVLGKMLLDFDAEHEPSRPWAYLDFDDPAVDPIDTARLIEHIARHIGLLYAGIEVENEAMGMEAMFIAVESDASTDSRGAPGFEFKSAGVTDIEELVGRLAEAINALPMEPSLLLVLDTFEQVQVRGRHAVDVTRNLLDKIVEAMPFARIIVSGRGDVAQWDDREQLFIGDLDSQSADQVLQALGVDSVRARNSVITQLGTNPLTLRLVAHGIQTGQLSADDLDNLIVGARSLELQGQLYTRILGHIQDGEVRRLAHPGLVVRRVTKGVIANVLAEICSIKADQIDKLFEKLPDHVALFETDEAAPEEGDALRHRQDVRENMLKLMVEDPMWDDKLADIHSGAIEHYKTIDHAIARAEELYHRLMRDDEPEKLDKLWSDELAASLSRSWGEPFPDRAALWLGTRLGRLQPEATSQLRVADREITIAREAASHISSGDFEGAIELLRKSSERSPGSPLYELEAKALASLGRHDEAITGAKRGLKEVSEAVYPRIAMSLYHIAAQSAYESSDFNAVKCFSDEAIRIANALNDTNASLQMLDLQVRANSGKKGATKPVETAQVLENLFLNANDRELRKTPAVSEQVVSTLGLNSRNVLRKAALTFGNRESQTLIKQDAFQLEKLLQRADETGSANIDLSQLATQVGLPSKDYTLIDLAGAAIRYGRMGDAMAVVLDHVGSQEDVRLETMSMFNLKDGVH